MTSVYICDNYVVQAVCFRTDHYVDETLVFQPQTHKWLGKTPAALTSQTLVLRACGHERSQLSL
jgi:hypothetical protein